MVDAIKRITQNPLQRGWRCPAARREILETVLFVTEKQATSIANGWSAPVPVRELHPLKSSAFHSGMQRLFSTYPLLRILNLE
jgi:hypothetical protein